MTELFPPEKPDLSDTRSVDDFKPATEWDIVKGMVRRFLIWLPIVFLVSYMPGRTGYRMHLTIPQRILFAAVVTVFANALDTWKRNN